MVDETVVAELSRAVDNWSGEGWFFARSALA
jgi:hypothetical protein